MALTKAFPRMIEGAMISVKDFGAVGDGVTDDSAAIQAAIDSGQNILFPQGRYKVSTTLTITDNNVYLKGVGQNAYGSGAHNGRCTEILFDCDPGIQFGESGDFAIYGLRIKDMAIGGTANCGDAIAMTSYKTYCALGEFENLMFSRDFERVFYLNPVVCKFSNIRVGESYSPISASARLTTIFDFEGTNGAAEGGAARATNANEISFCDFRNCDTGIKSTYGTTLRIIDCRFETLDDTAIILQGMFNTYITRCYFENIGGTNLVSANTTLSRGCYIIRLENNLITNMPNVTQFVGGTWAARAVFIGNEFASGLNSVGLPRNTYTTVFNNDIRVGESSIAHETAHHLTTDFQLDGTSDTTYNFTVTLPTEGCYMVHVYAMSDNDEDHLATRTFIVNCVANATTVNDLLTVQNLVAMQQNTTRFTNVVINSVNASREMDVDITMANSIGNSMGCQTTMMPLFINNSGALKSSGGM